MAGKDNNTDWVGEDFDLGDWTTWEWYHVACLWFVLVAGQELMSYLLKLFESMSDRRIPVGGRYLEHFSWKDWLFVYINRLSVPFMIYHMFAVTWNSKHVPWAVDKIGFMNTVGPLVPLYALYDFIYAPFHGLLHVRGIYWLIHKHHHQNSAPSRGNLDASNTHPVEFVLGEYIHVFCVFAVSEYIMEMHALSVFLFMFLGGIMASLNHTRVDFGVPFVFDVKAHDTHHRIPNANYGQYTMYMDKFMGTYRPYEKELIHIQKKSS